MADIDPHLIGSVLSEIPMDNIISAPLQAMIKAQVSASKSYADFILNVCFDKETGKAKTLEFDYDEVIPLEDGTHTTQSRKVVVPLATMIDLPNIGVTEGKVSFNMTVSQSYSSHSSTKAQGSFDAKMDWGLFTVEVKGSASHQSEQTRKTDTRARYGFDVQMNRCPTPEGLQRVLDVIMNAAIKGTGGDNKTDTPVTPDTKKKAA